MHVIANILTSSEWLWWPLAGVLIISIIVTIVLFVRTKRLKRMLTAEIREKQQIISIISHDVKAPFNRVLTLAQLIAMEKPPLSDTQMDFLDKIHQTIADGINLMRNLIDYRNILYRRIEIVKEEVNISDLVKSAVMNATSLAHKKQLKITTDIIPDIQTMSDHLCISRTVDNLVNNAIKFSRPLKEINISLRETDQQEIIIEVKDEGPGFTPEDLGKMYQRFQRLTPQPTAGESSTGLGLFIARSMIERVDGTIQCISKQGVGSTFIIKLPGNKKGSDKSATHAKAQQGSQTGP